MQFNLEMTENQAKMLAKKLGAGHHLSKQLTEQLPPRKYKELLDKHRDSLVPFVVKQIGDRVTDDEYKVLVHSVDLLEMLIEAREYIFEHAPGKGLPEGMTELLKLCVPSEYRGGIVAWVR